MLSLEDDVEAHALHRQGWTISAIARHLGRSRTTIRAYLAGTSVPGQRRCSVPNSFAAIEPYIRARLTEDAHVWASALFDEVQRLGYERSYQRFTHELRVRQLRPHCEACAGVRGRPTIEIEHPPGEEVQWDWNELPSPWSEGDAHLLTGTLAYSGQTRGVFAESEDQAYLIEAIDAVLRMLGGTARQWRFDRMGTVSYPVARRGEGVRCLRSDRRMTALAVAGTTSKRSASGQLAGVLAATTCGLTDDFCAPFWSGRRQPTHGRLTRCGN
jgi:transposase